MPSGWVVIMGCTRTSRRGTDRRHWQGLVEDGFRLGLDPRAATGDNGTSPLANSFDRLGMIIETVDVSYHDRTASTVSTSPRCDWKPRETETESERSHPNRAHWFAITCQRQISPPLRRSRSAQIIRGRKRRARLRDRRGRTSPVRTRLSEQVRCLRACRMMA